MADNDRGRNIAAWVIGGLLCLAFLGSGGMKLSDLDKMGEMFGHFGYSAGFGAFIAACEIAGAIGVLIPRLASAAAAGLAIIMVGAAGSHVMAGDPLTQAAPPVVLLLLCLTLAWLRRADLVGVAGARA